MGNPNVKNPSGDNPISTAVPPPQPLCIVSTIIHWTLADSVILALYSSTLKVWKDTMVRLKYRLSALTWVYFHPYRMKHLEYHGFQMFVISDWISYFQVLLRDKKNSLHLNGFAGWGYIQLYGMLIEYGTRLLPTWIRVIKWASNQYAAAR